MGLLVQNDAIIMKDGNGIIKFSTDRQMPHLLNVASGSFTLGNVSGTSTYTEIFNENSSSMQFSNFVASNVIRHTVIDNSDVISGSEAFVSPFITLSRGVFQTPAGHYMSALGSNVVELFVRNDGYFVGSIILNLEITGSKVELVARTEISVGGNYTITGFPYSGTIPNTGGGTVSVPATITGTAFSVSYKVYYGRFN